MDLESAIAKHQPDRVKDVCVVKALLERLDEKNRQALQTALDRGVPNHIICKALRAEKLKMSEESLRLHKAGACKCEIR